MFFYSSFLVTFLLEYFCLYGFVIIFKEQWT